MKEIKYKTLTIEHSIARRIREDLSLNADVNNIRQRYDKDHTESYIVSFGKGIEMDIKLCCSNFYESDTSNPLWTEAVLFDDGHEIAKTDPEDRFFGLWEIETNDTIYMVNVVDEGLSASEIFEHLDFNKLSSEKELISYLDNRGYRPRDFDLFDFLLTYEDEYARDALWLYPLCDRSNIGKYLVPVKEGILSIPYNKFSFDQNKLLDTHLAHIVTADHLQELLDSWEHYNINLTEALTEMIKISDKKRSIKNK